MWSFGQSSHNKHYWSGEQFVCLIVTMGCTPSIQDNTEVTETSQEDAQKIVERVYSAKTGRILSMKDIEGIHQRQVLKVTCSPKNCPYISYYILIFNFPLPSFVCFILSLSLLK